MPVSEVVETRGVCRRFILNISGDNAVRLNAAGVATSEEFCSSKFNTSGHA